ncbi:hypothetical protein LTR97_000437 [Elasticomyces elasticus]|uniref:Uncharacterized protein n=1 Tax=Elasticomyces elasticus TaxID=574655 RepID=A0AAN8A6J4_9PEZI|nr:hypothetical protein LTR97_000437 [Elasticomyces elasticus]
MEGFVHHAGSFLDDVVGAMHYPIFTTKQPKYSSIRDPPNCCTRWPEKMFGGTEEILIPHAQGARSPSRTSRMGKSQAGGTGEDEQTLSQATVGFQVGAENAARYKRYFPNSVFVDYCEESIYGEDIHAYIELGSDGQMKRLTFLIYHPEALMRGEGYRRPVFASTIMMVSHSIAIPRHNLEVMVLPRKLKTDNDGMREVVLLPWEDEAISKMSASGIAMLQEAYKRARARTALKLWKAIASCEFVPGARRRTLDCVSMLIVRVFGEDNVTVEKTKLAKMYNRIVWLVIYEAGLVIYVPKEDTLDEFKEFLD